jgi:hypothetical protein
MAGERSRLYRNVGAPFWREDGTKIDRGAVFEPTDDELLRLAYKLQPFSPEPQTATSGDAGTVPELLYSRWPRWPLKLDPVLYLRLHPRGAYADLARELTQLPPPTLAEEAGGAADAEREGGGEREDE